MRLDAVRLIDGSLSELLKAHKKVKKNFKEKIDFLFNFIQDEFEGERGYEIKEIINSILTDEFSKHEGSYLSAMDKIRSLLERGI